jgi:hypothetical protein
MQLLLKSFTPMYQQLVAKAREAFEPRLVAAEEQVAASAARVEVLRAELEALTANVITYAGHWRRAARGKRCSAPRPRGWPARPLN